MATVTLHATLADLIGDADAHTYRYDGAKVRIGRINVLPQPRKTFDGLEELALDIAKKKILNPPTVARFGREGCAKYLAIVNHLWGSSFRLEEMRTADGAADSYYVLLAGERRFRSCRLLWEKGCAECRERHGAESEGRCFRRHFGGNEIDVRLCVDIPPLPALFLQLSENTHMAVPPHEEAAAYALLFKLLRSADETFSVARFSREVGRSPETIRRALRFCELPETIRDAVEKGYIAYGIAVEIARLKESGENEASLDYWLSRAIAENLKVPAFREMAGKFIADKRSGQTSLLGIFQESQQHEAERAHVRKVVAAGSIKAVWTWVYYLTTVQKLYEAGKLGTPEAIFSEGSPVRVFRQLLERLDAVLPHLKKRLPRRDRERAASSVATARRLIAAFADDGENRTS
jgi:hypothetical protein